MNLPRPSAKTATTPADLASWLAAAYDVLLPLSKDAISPDRIPALLAITMPTLEEMRATRGDANGLSGPRACILVGKVDPLDGSEGLFAWDATSVATDDDAETTVESPAAGVPDGAPGRWRRVGASAGRVLRSTVLTGTTLAVFPGTRNYRLRMWGAGGGGGGAANGGLTAGGGGGAGAPVERFGNPLAATYTFALGAGGTGGSTAGGDGGNGGDSTFSVGGVLVTAPGGSGGKGSAAVGAGVSAGGDGGALSTNGTTNGGGCPGDNGFVAGATFASGSGGSTSIGGGGRGITGTNSTGSPPVGPGAGGGGALNDGGAGVGRAGAAGADGYGILEELS